MPFKLQAEVSMLPHCHGEWQYIVTEEENETGTDSVGIYHSLVPLSILPQWFCGLNYVLFPNGNFFQSKVAWLFSCIVKKKKSTQL